jgi:hypothetical protein
MICGCSTSVLSSKTGQSVSKPIDVMLPYSIFVREGFPQEEENKSYQYGVVLQQATD